MAAKTTLGTFWHMPDDLWALIAPVVGPGKAAGTVGRPPRPFRQIFDGILYVLCTGCQWHALPRRVYGPRLHCARSFHPVGAIRMFYEAWQRVLAYSDGAIGIDLFGDCGHTKKQYIL